MNDDGMANKWILPLCVSSFFFPEIMIDKNDYISVYFPMVLKRIIRHSL